MNDLDIIVLAGGKGTRMGGDIAKVLTPVAGRPMLSYVLDAVRGVLSHDPVVVVGYQAEKVKETFGADGRYAHQAEQRGTGHAVKVALAHVRPEAKYIFVLYGDHPVIKAETIRSVYEKHSKKDRFAPVTLATVRVPDFNEWRTSFFDFGRIIRYADGSIVKIVE
ncbi:MAG: bifunctional UDP-N-acetylglucosamine pyrophosphorylase/Glucosamine-phosphate N-acetyltransferase, partial [Candidatus Taylorbacteria bacterium]|nr:bifunctional UDP-N-acetylglucosamine pyrophosphorylase/Glucosamine-phosphate N-acetyltransferase [Candidatus Taylorbacteria bacterium]